MRIPILGTVIDERFLSHRQRSTSLASVIGGMVAVGLFGYRYFVNGIKGRTENAMLSLPFKAAYMFRPGAVIPLHGIRSRTRWYNAVYLGLRPLYPLLSRLAPTMITTTEQLGRAMLAVARNGYPAHVLEIADINRL